MDIQPAAADIQNRHRRIRFAIICTALLAAWLPGGCLRPMLPPSVSVYIPKAQTESLTGKIVVIDPGHGGSEMGAIGQNGLREAEVNLGVALYLWGFLKDAGANPVLTRTTDACVDRSQPFDLKRELAARAALSNACNADLFISIHHNADVRNRRRDDVIVFYKMGDTGPSRDIAREVCAGLAHWLTPDKASVEPGNFHVLRATRAPAILGEASFLTTKKTATLLAYHRTLAAEAAGYFQGICAYFQKGVPTITGCSPDNATVAQAQPEITCRVSAGADNASLDAASLAVSLDGERQSACSLQGDRVRCLPAAPIANGLHRYCMTVRNSNGNRSPEYCAAFRVALPARHIIMTPLFPVIPSAVQSHTPLTLRVVDALQRPVADGTEIRLAASAGRIEPAQLSVSGGVAHALLYADPQKSGATVYARCGDAAASAQVAFGTPTAALFLARVQDAAAVPLGGAALLRDGSTVSVSDASGFVHETAAAAGPASYEIRRKGYMPALVPVTLRQGMLTTQTVSLIPVDDGLFMNRRVMLDATDVAPSKQPVCAALAALIENAGGTAAYCWTDPPAPPEAQRVLRARSARADVFIRVAPARKPVVRHYYKSVAGETIASRFSELMNQGAVVRRGSWRAEPGADYVLAQTDMPAIVIAAPEEALRAAGDVAGQAYAVLRDFFAQQRGSGQPLSNDRVPSPVE